MSVSVPQKILFVIDQFRNPNAGTEGQLYQLIQHLDRSLFEPELLVFKSSDWLRINEFPCPWQELGSTRLSSLKTWWRLSHSATKYKRRGFNLAHVFFNDPSLICPPVFSFYGIKTLISRRDMGYWYTPTMLKLLNISRRFCSGVVVNSQAVAEITIISEGFSRECVHVIYNGYENTDCSINSADDDHPLAQLKSKRRLLVGLVANIRPIKRMQDAVSAVARIANKYPELDLVIIGDGNQDALKHQARDLGVESRLHLLGGRTDIQVCLGYLDIGLLCSESEGFSNALVEYLMAGLAVVASRVGGNPEAIANDISGLLYDCGDIEALSAALSKIAVDPEYRRALGAAAKSDVSERFSVEKMLAEQQKVYKTVLEQL